MGVLLACSQTQIKARLRLRSKVNINEQGHPQYQYSPHHYCIQQLLSYCIVVILYHCVISLSSNHCVTSLSSNVVVCTVRIVSPLV